MTLKDKLKVVRHWERAAELDWSTSEVLFKNRKYIPALFYCHLCLEKILKAHVVKLVGDHAPHTHNLPYLAGKTDLQFSKVDLEFLDLASDFNIGTRYPEDIDLLYQKMNKEFAKETLKEAKRLYTWLKNLL